MAPKKQSAAEAPPRQQVLGRFSNNLKMGIVGLPNVGKSTYFNTLAKLNVPAENYPFCTIEPNEARVGVPDERFDWLCEAYKPASRVPAFLQVWDIAGLVRGAHEGQGLGNAFLSNIQAVDGLFHVCRAFEDSEVTHVEGAVDPVRDLRIIDEELRFKDTERVARLIDELVPKIERAGNNAPKAMRFELDTLHKVQRVLEHDQLVVRKAAWSNAEIEVLNQHLFLTSKPAVYLVNVSERDYARKKNKWLPRVKELVGDELVIPFSAAFEAALVDAEQNEGAEGVRRHAEANAGAASVLPKIVKAGYRALQLIYFFTVGSDEVKAWSIRQGTLAPQAAGAIHTDFERGFICAEVMRFDELRELGGEAAAKAAGKCRQQGKSYPVEDGDVILFKFNVTSQKK